MSSCTFLFLYLKGPIIFFLPCVSVPVWAIFCLQLLYFQCICPVLLRTFLGSFNVTCLRCIYQDKILFSLSKPSLIIINTSFTGQTFSMYGARSSPHDKKLFHSCILLLPLETNGTSFSLNFISLKPIIAKVPLDHIFTQCLLQNDKTKILICFFNKGHLIVQQAKNRILTHIELLSQCN